MEFKKKIIEDYCTKINTILSVYKQEYLEIVGENKGDQSIITNPSILSGNFHQDSGISSEKNFFDNNKENEQNTNENGLSICYLDNSHDNFIGDIAQADFNCNTPQKNLNFEIEKQNISCNTTKIGKDNRICANNEELLKEKQIIEERTILETKDNDLESRYMKCNIDNTQMPSNIQSAVISSKDIPNSLIVESSTIDTSQMINQSFNCEFRRKARRRTGKIVVKRRLPDDEVFEDNNKRPKTEQHESFLILLAEDLKLKKERDIANEYKKEMEELKKKLGEVEEAKTKKLENEKKDLDRIKKENLDISLKLQKELEELSKFKDNLFIEMRRFEEEKKVLEKERERVLLEKIELEKKAFQEKHNAEAQKIEIEKSMIVEEKKKLEVIKESELRKLEEQRSKIERERALELHAISEEKKRIEKMIEEQNRILESERKLLKDERDKINQTFLEISNKTRNETIRPQDYQSPINCSFKKPSEKKITIIQPLKNINSVFQSIKKEFLMKNSMAEPTMPYRPAKRHVQVFDVDRIDPHSLYKKSIDIQSNQADPKRYVPKINIPFYHNDDEFELEEKKFEPALFTKDPKLNYLVKTQNESEIRELFGNKKEIDVEKIFDTIENVTNFSPNKIRYTSYGRG